MYELIERNLGLARSVAIYFAPGRVRRLSRFYGSLIKPGNLCFDIGAHVGNRTAAWLRIGARVVVVEPQAHLMAWLRRLYGRSTAVVLVESAVAAAPGTAILRHDPRNPTVSTLSDEWIHAVRRDASFDKVRWRAAETVSVTTLDALIAAHGTPIVCKIDIEGYEAEALRGLSQPLPIISFEYIPAAIGVAADCLFELSRLGEYRYNWFVGESHRWASPEWLEAGEMNAQLGRLAAEKRSGDIFARLSRPQSRNP